MQWTDELNALLNQCVFASGYDFDASSELLCQQAAKLRLWTGDEELKLTANQCQEQWMALNPAEDDDDRDDDEEDKADRPETEANEHVGPRASELHDTAPPEGDGDGAEEESVVVPDGGPRLELSLSDAELDMLLSTLPPSEEEPEVSSSADSKDRQRSEMQWVLAFLTDPDAIASVDVEAKKLMGSPEKHEDDNYQVFLQDLQEANLMSPAPTAIARHSQRQEVAGPATDEDNGVAEGDSSDDEDEEEWERTRREMKAMKLL